MDELRSCYSTQCRFFKDDPRTSTIHWYFVDASTPDLPFGTAFTSNEWLDVPEGDQEIGEVPGAVRTWQNGLPPFPVAGDGHFCGTQEDFQVGGAVPDPPIALNVYGGPACCPTPPSPFVHFRCRACPDGSYDVYTLQVAGGTGAFAGYNGNFLLTYRGGCIWASNSIHSPGPPPHDAIWRLRALGFYPTNALVVELLDLLLPSTPVYDSSAAVSCLDLETADLRAGGPAGAAPFVVVLPGAPSLPGLFCPAQGAVLPSGLVVRWPAPAIAVNFVPVAQDDPFTADRPCHYRGIVLWSTRIPLSNLVPVFTPATLTFGPLRPGDPAGLITLGGSTPLFSPFAYTATAPAWDLSPIALNLVGGTFPLFGLPASVLLYTQSDLPP